MTRLVMASNNAKKLAELRRILAPLVPDIEVVPLADVADYPEPIESESTFEGNALLKARACADATRLPAVADDSGLCVDALNGMPGVLSARWSGVAEGADAANNRLLLAQLSQVPQERRGAEFRCAMALVLPGGQEFTETGAMPGTILHEERGDHGFGYDPLFQPDGHDESAAQLSPEAKDAISHRGKAVRAMAQRIAQALGSPEGDHLNA